MSNTDKLREFCENWRSDLIKHGGIPEMLSDLTALVSENYYQKEFTTWYAYAHHDKKFKEMSMDEIYNYWKENGK